MFGAGESKGRFTVGEAELVERLIAGRRRYKLTAPEMRACHAVIVNVKFGADMSKEDEEIARTLIERTAWRFVL